MWRARARLAAERGIATLDGPISGGGGGAKPSTPAMTSITQRRTRGALVHLEASLAITMPSKQEGEAKRDERWLSV
jgi:hypothetical protein